MIELPNYNWFVTAADGRPSSNTMTGSLGTVSNSGCLNKRTFNYKVSVSNVGKEDVKLIAKCWIQPPWNSENKIENYETKEFEGSADGIVSASKWLSESAKALDIIG